MIYRETGIPGVLVVALERLEDERGSFARTYCEREFAARGLETRWVQCSLSSNAARGTLRGMHYQAEPEPEVKLVRCTRGAIHDVVVDLRPDSPTFRQWVGIELSAENGLALYVPTGIAHGFQTLEPHSDVLYQISAFYRPELARSVRWDDPAFGIEWPDDVRTISAKDRAVADFSW